MELFTPSAVHAPALLTESEAADLASLEATIERGLQTFVEVGTALASIRERRLYRQVYGTFEDYCQAQWGMDRTYAHRTIEAARVVVNLLPIGNAPANEAQARPLVGLEPEEQREVWERVVETAAGGRITAALVETVRAEMYPDGRPHVAQNSGDNEWYTPPEFLAAAREVLGGFDLDPASTTKANEAVQAARFYTKEDDGLAQEWQGRVWMNPPYAKELIGRFTSKLCQHYTAGEVSAAVVLVNNGTETKWFQEMAEYASAFAFPKGRVRFPDPEGNPGAPLQGQALLYFGDRPVAFRAAFLAFGFVL